MEPKKSTHGGSRPGAGRPNQYGEQKVYSFKLPVELMNQIEGSKVAFVRAAIVERLAADLQVSTLEIWDSINK